MTIDPELKKRFEKLASGLDEVGTVASYEDMAVTARFLLAEADKLAARKAGENKFGEVRGIMRFREEIIEQFIALCEEAQK